MWTRTALKLSLIHIFPYNYYAVMTVVMSLFLIFTGAEFGPMKLNEDNAQNGDLFTTADRPYGNDVDDGTDTCGHVADPVSYTHLWLWRKRPAG